MIFFDYLSWKFFLLMKASTLIFHNRIGQTYNLQYGSHGKYVKTLFANNTLQLQ